MHTLTLPDTDIGIIAEHFTGARRAGFLESVSVMRESIAHD